jgi:DNA-binding transcriptional regulator YdaS (Cro superfamily)
MKLAEFLNAERGRNAKVAADARIAPAFLSQIANGVRPAPAEKCYALERACDHHVRRWDLRPNDWHRIWPELIGAAGARRAACTTRTRGGARCSVSRCKAAARPTCSGAWRHRRQRLVGQQRVLCVLHAEKERFR